MASADTHVSYMEGHRKAHAHWSNVARSWKVSTTPSKKLYKLARHVAATHKKAYAAHQNAGASAPWRDSREYKPFHNSRATMSAMRLSDKAETAERRFKHYRRQI